MKLPAIIPPRGAGAKLEQARSTLATATARLAQLEKERRAALIDDVEALPRINASIAQQRQIVVDATDRIAGLRARKTTEDTAALERYRSEAIDTVIVPAAAECVAAVAKWERMAAEMVVLWQTIEAQRAAINSLPAGVPRPRAGNYAVGLESFKYVVRTEYQSTDVDKIIRDLKLVPGTASRVRGIFDNFIRDCREAPLPPAVVSDDAVEEAA